MRMQALAACPVCGAKGFEQVFPYNDLRYLVRAADADLARSEFAACPRCGLIFASRRQPVEDFDEYYTRFAEWENRTYAVYPPPATFVRGKAEAAAELARVLVDQKLIRPGARVLHIRCDGGALMAHLRDHHGVEHVYGLDVFDTNRRFAREHYRLEHVERLSFGAFAIPFAPIQFDLIISNHLLTHAGRPREAFATIRDRLARGGAVFLYNEHDHLLGVTRGAPFLRDGINNFHKQLFTEETLRDALALFGADTHVVGHRNTSPLLVARAAPPVAPGDLPSRDHAPFVDAFRSWAEGHERRWRRNVKRRLRQKYRAIDRLAAGLGRVARRLGGGASAC